MKVILIVRSCFRYMSNTEQRCSVCWMRSSRVLSMMERPEAILRREIPSEFVHSITDMTKKEFLFLPVKRKIWLDSVRRSARFHRDIITKTEHSSAIMILAEQRKSVRMM